MVERGGWRTLSSLTLVLVRKFMKQRKLSKVSRQELWNHPAGSGESRDVSSPLSQTFVLATFMLTTATLQAWGVRASYTETDGNFGGSPKLCVLAF